MRICRFNEGRVGIVRGDRVYDVTDLVGGVLPLIPPDIDAVALARLPASNLSDIRLLSPIASPGKIVAAPVNYHAHAAEAVADPGIVHGHTQTDIGQAGLFLKAPSSLVGPDEGVALRFPDRRNDHEVELVAVIGRGGSGIPEQDALSHVAGYAIGLDITLRGPEDRSFRKSIDTYSVLGPWFVTADEVGDPGDLGLRLSVNGAPRQDANTRSLVYGVPRLIAFASSFYTLHPGDLIFTGTPEGVGPIRPGDVIDAAIDRIGAMRVAVRAHDNKK